jgi:hypothetical protein
MNAMPAGLDPTYIGPDGYPVRRVDASDGAVLAVGHPYGTWPDHDAVRLGADWHCSAHPAGHRIDPHYSVVAFVGDSDAAWPDDDGDWEVADRDRLDDLVGGGIDL